MRTIYKTSEIVKWLYEMNCNGTAETLKDRAQTAEFVDSSILRSLLIDEIYDALRSTFPGHTCATKSFM